MSDTEEIENLLQQFMDHLHSGEFEKVMALCDFEKEYLHLGTTQGEYYFGKVAWEDAVNLMINIGVIFTRRKDLQINVAGNFAWSISEIDILLKIDDRETLHPARMTVNLLKNNNPGK